MRLDGQVVICGLGHVGFRVFELLDGLGLNITVISESSVTERRNRVESSGARYIEGDARADSVLIESGIRTADSILALTDNDLVNVSIVSDARRLNPGIRIVARMYDTDLGSHIAREFGISNIFSASNIAAPVFINALSGRSLPASLSLNGRRYAISDRLPPEESDNGIPLHFQDSSTVTLYGIPEEPVGQGNTGRIRSILGIAAAPALGKFRKTLALICTVLILASVFLSFAMPMKLVDAVYFVTTTITTVGYGDYSFIQAPAHLKLFGCLLMLSGAMLLTILFSTVTDILLTEKLARFTGGVPLPKGGHIILAGAGNVGIRIAEELAEMGAPLVLLQDVRNGEFPLEILRRAAVAGGSARSIDTLARANVSTARGIIAVSDNDVENLGICLAAKKENPDTVCIARVFDADLGRKLQGQLSIDRILSVSAIAAPYFAAAALGGVVHLALVWKDHLLYLKSFEGQADSFESLKCMIEKLER